MAERSIFEKTQPLPYWPSIASNCISTFLLAQKYSFPCQPEDWPWRFRGKKFLIRTAFDNRKQATAQNPFLTGVSTTKWFQIDPYVVFAPPISIARSK